jgi:hypothetical protein
LTPKDNETTEVEAAETVSNFFVELNASIDGIKLPEPKDNSELIAELKASNDKLMEQFSVMQKELIQLKGQKSGAQPAKENAAPGGNDKRTESLSASQKQNEKAGNFFKKQYKKR